MRWDGCKGGMEGGLRKDGLKEIGQIGGKKGVGVWREGWKGLWWRVVWWEG